MTDIEKLNNYFDRIKDTINVIESIIIKKDITSKYLTDDNKKHLSLPVNHICSPEIPSKFGIRESVYNHMYIFHNDFIVGMKDFSNLINKILEKKDIEPIDNKIFDDIDYFLSDYKTIKYVNVHFMDFTFKFNKIYTIHDINVDEFYSFFRFNIPTEGYDLIYYYKYNFSLINFLVSLKREQIEILVKKTFEKCLIDEFHEFMEYIGNESKFKLMCVDIDKALKITHTDDTERKLFIYMIAGIFYNNISMTINNRTPEYWSKTKENIMYDGNKTSVLNNIVFCNEVFVEIFNCYEYKEYMEIYDKAYKLLSD